MSSEQSKNSILTPPFWECVATFGLDETNVLRLPETRFGCGHWGPVSVSQLSFDVCLPAC